MRFFIAILLVVCTSGFLHSAQASASCDNSTIPIIPLETGKDAPYLKEYLLYSKKYDGIISQPKLLDALTQFECIDSVAIVFGLANDPITVLFAVENRSMAYGTWIYSSNRYSARRFTMYDITNTDATVIIDNLDKHEALKNIRRYMGFGESITLAPGEKRIFAIRMELENTTSFPTFISSANNFGQTLAISTTRTGSIASAILAIVILNLLLFRATKRSEFGWLAAAETSYVYLFLHSTGVIDRFGLSYFPIFSIASADMAKCLFSILMAQFGRMFLKTTVNFPITDKVLRTFIFTGLLLVFLWVISIIAGAEMRAILRTASWALIFITALYLPVVAFAAIEMSGDRYWPLLVGWTGFALYAIYAFLSFTGLFKLVPISAAIMGYTGLVEILFVTISLAMGIYFDNKNYQSLLIDNTMVLEEKLRLIEDQAIASATIQDQNALLHASGHDTKQVLMAIDNATYHLENQNKNVAPELLETLKASSIFLKDILSTTLSASTASTENRRCIALSIFSVRDFFRFLEKIYRPLFHKDGLEFQVNIRDDIKLISDKALLTRAISNFMVNSLKFTAKGGMYCDIASENEQVIITLRDTGPGIPLEKLNSLFSDDSDRVAPDRSQDSTGSGFKIAHAIIRQLKGHIYVTNDNGTTIKITLPLAASNFTTTSVTDFGESANFTLHDIDKFGTQHDSDPERTLGVTFDNSSQMRSRAAETFTIILYKPLTKNMFDHPALLE